MCLPHAIKSQGIVICLMRFNVRVVLPRMSKMLDTIRSTLRLMLEGHRVGPSLRPPPSPLLFDHRAERLKSRDWPCNRCVKRLRSPGQDRRNAYYVRAIAGRYEVGRDALVCNWDKAGLGFKRHPQCTCILCTCVSTGYGGGEAVGTWVGWGLVKPDHTKRIPRCQGYVRKGTLLTFPLWYIKNDYSKISKTAKRVLERDRNTGIERK